MRKSFCRAVLLLSLLCATTVEAAPTYYLFNAGVSYPVAPGNFNDNWQIGFNLGIGLERQITKVLHWQIYFDYNNFAIDDEEYAKFAGYYEPGVSVDGGTASILSLSVNLKRMMGRARSGEAPYFIGGVGLYRFSIGDGSFATRATATEIVSESETSIGANVGAGMDIRIGARTSFYIEARYFLGFTSDESTHHVPLRVGIIFK